MSKGSRQSEESASLREGLFLLLLHPQFKHPFRSTETDVVVQIECKSTDKKGEDLKSNGQPCMKLGQTRLMAAEFHHCSGLGDRATSCETQTLYSSTELCLNTLPSL